MNLKRIIAILGIAVLALLYIATLVSAILATPATNELFKACLYATIVVPVLLYGYLLVYKLSKQRAEASKKELEETFARMTDAKSDEEDSNME